MRCERARGDELADGVALRTALDFLRKGDAPEGRARAPRATCLYGAQLFCSKVSLRSRRPSFSGNF
jgi:hypothetical protein